MKNEGNLSIYTHKAIDVDYSTYLVINADVVMWRSGNNAMITAILSDFSNKVDRLAEERIYIKGNRLFFTFEGVKYYFIPTCWATEWLVIEELLVKLSKVADNVAYKMGELD